VDSSLDGLAYWVALSDSPLPPDVVIQFYGEYGSVEGLWTAPLTFLKERVAQPGAIKRFVDYRSTHKIDDFRRILDTARDRGVSVVRYVDKEYPEQLRLIKGRPPKAPPLVLFWKGDLGNAGRGIAIVGTRQCSEVGRAVAREVARRVAGSHFTVVSGLARGIDTEAHNGALDEDGKTTAVLAWLDPVYPPENKQLLESLLRKGLVIAERYTVPQGTDSRRLFVERNRITSGISDALVIIESANVGGTVWQFDFAREQGIPVFVLEPRTDDSTFAEGYKYFVKRGGTPFATSEELLQSLRGLQSRMDRFISRE
jgi:DNA processing protein